MQPSPTPVDLALTGCTAETARRIDDERLLPPTLLRRLHARFPQHSALYPKGPLMFQGRQAWRGLAGFREVWETLRSHGIDPGHQVERELFVEVYRFLATRHTLNRIDWTRPDADPLYHLVFPQPGMIRREVVDRYAAAATAEERTAIAAAFMEETNPHDGKQQLNKPWLLNDEGEVELVDGSQHKYPQVQLIFDQSTQSCFSFCTYCFRHAQVRGDEDMFLQKDIDQVHAYLRAHPEVSDVLITGGDAGYLTAERFRQYTTPLMEDDALLHVRTLRLGSRVLTYDPERILSPVYDPLLARMDELYDHGIQVAFMAHFSTPGELLHPLTLAAIRRLQAHHVVIRSQSPMIKHVGMWDGPDGHLDIERSAQNWIDLGAVLGCLGIGFHSIYIPRPTGQWQYFTAPLSEIHQVYDRIYRSLPSIGRPSRHISMTTSAGKVSILGRVDVGGEQALALKFSEARDMDWLDPVWLARIDDHTNNIAELTPWQGDRFFFEDDLRGIEARLQQELEQARVPA